VDTNLPYDVIHLLDRFFRLAGEAVIGHGGFIDKYMGDGMMAIFGLHGGDARTVCRSALGAGLELIKRVEELDEYTRKYFNVGFHAGVGIHYGNALLGSYGHPAKMQFSAIGDTVNVASRIESATKQLQGTGLLCSDAVFEAVENDVHVTKVVRCPLKGKNGDHVLYQVDRLLEQDWASLPEDLKLQSIQRAVRRVVTRRTAPLFLRLSYHDAITYDPATGEGGPDGSIRFPEELSRKESRGLQVAIGMLEQVKGEVPEASWADMIMVAGAAAVARAGGPEIEMRVGRKDASKPTRDGLMPDRNWGPAEIRAYFTRLGFEPRLYTALSGAHTLGRIDGKTFTDDPYKFDNTYFRMLLRFEGKVAHVMSTDRALYEDEECRHWVKEFALSREAFFESFGEAYVKMSELGFAK
jgi:adenylate cyclase